MSKTNNNIDYKADSKDSKKTFGGDITKGSKDEKGSNNDEKRSNNDKKRSNNDENRSNNDEKRSNNDEKRSNNDKKRSNNDEKRSNNDEKGSNNDEKGSNNDEKGSNSITTETCEIDPNWDYVKGKNGCDGGKMYSSKKPTKTRPVKVNTYIDRFGYPTGSFFSPLYQGGPWSYSSRSIPYIKHTPDCENTYELQKNKMYHLYKVIKEFNVYHCGAEPIPYYGTEGGAEQYFLKNDESYSQYDKNAPITNVQDLLDKDYIEEIDPTEYPLFGVYDGGSKHRKQKPTHRKKISKRRKNKAKRKTKKQKLTN